MVEVSAGWGQTLKAHLLEKQAELSATPPMARTIATSAVGDKVLSITWYCDAAEWVTEAAYLDMALAVFSFLFVFLYVWVNTQSIVLTLAGMFEIFMSVPLALFCWKILGGQKYVDFLSLVSVYIVVCIGADDIFVFVDTWKLSRAMPKTISGSLETRFAWTFKRAAGTMLTTTATTTICLFVSALAPMPAIRAFGTFAGLLIVVDFLQVITWFPAIVLIKAKFCEECCAKCCTGPCKPETGPKERAATVFLRDKLAPFLRKWRFGFLAISLLLVGGAGAIIPTMAKFTENLVFLNADHPFQYFIDVRASDFYSSEDWKDRVKLLYGVAPNPVTYETGGQVFPATDAGFNTTLHYDAAFTFDAATQQAIVDDCDAAKTAVNAAGVKLVANDEVYCLLNDLRDFGPGPFPLETEAELRAALDAFVVSDVFNERRDNVSKGDDYSSWHTGYVADGDDGIKALWVSLNTTMPTNLEGSLSLTLPHFDDWNAFHASLLPRLRGRRHRRLLPGGVVGLRRLLRHEPLAAVVCAPDGYVAVAAAFIVLLMVTANIIIALYATLTICVVIAFSLAMMALGGTTFGLWEFIFTILAIGMSVDYAVHLAHFYNEAPGTRYEKAQAALHGVGISVIGGAITTVVAAAPLLFCVFSFFKAEGIFIFATSLSAILFSFILLIPLFMTIGPQGEQGDLQVLLRLCGLKKAKAPAGATKTQQATPATGTPDESFNDVAQKA